MGTGYHSRLLHYFFFPLLCIAGVRQMITLGFAAVYFGTVEHWAFGRHEEMTWMSDGLRKERVDGQGFDGWERPSR
jgi:hypothetical protein